MSDPWKRREVIGDCTLYLGDCLEVLPSLSSDLDVVSDPPYGINHVKGSGGGRGAASKGTKRNIMAIAGDAAPFDPAHLLHYDNVLIWGADHYAARLPADQGRWLAWNKLDDMESFDSFSDVEFAWHSRKGAARIFSFKWKGIASVKAGEELARSHPTQKPITLMKWCLVQAGGSRPILDPYMGSGTTGVACVHSGRPFVGIEIDEGHFETACKRIRDAYAQPDMFVSAPEPQPEQLSILDGAA